MSNRNAGNPVTRIVFPDSEAYSSTLGKIGPKGKSNEKQFIGFQVGRDLGSGSASKQPEGWSQGLTSEPEPVVDWSKLLGIAGWGALVAGAFIIVAGCGRFRLVSCGSTLIFVSGVTMAGGILLIALGIVAAEKNKRALVKNAILGIIAWMVILVVLAALLYFCGPSCLPL